MVVGLKNNEFLNVVGIIRATVGEIVESLYHESSFLFTPDDRKCYLCPRTIVTHLSDPCSIFIQGVGLKTRREYPDGTAKPRPLSRFSSKKLFCL